jgi:hypothetical protein
MQEVSEKIGRREVVIKDLDSGKVFVGVLVNGRISRQASGTFSAREKAEAYVQSLRDAEVKAQGCRDAKRAEVAAAKASFANPYKVGDLLHYSWGYDQTQCEFAQVVGVGPRSVTIREIAGRFIRGNSDMSEYLSPVRDHFLDTPARRINLTFAVYDSKLHCRIPADYGSWTACEEGREYYHSWYA